MDRQEIEDLFNEEEEYKNSIKRALLDSEVALDFVKADGTNRKMKATLNPELIAEAIGTGSSVEDEKHVDSPDHQVVFDLDKKAWRCFKWSRLISAAFNTRPVGRNDDVRTRH